MSIVKDLLVITISMGGGLILASLIITNIEENWEFGFIPVMVVINIGLGAGLLMASRIIGWLQDIHAWVIISISWGVGLFMAFILFSTGRLNNRGFWTPGLSRAYDIIHSPAWGITLLWWWVGFGFALLEAWLDLRFGFELRWRLGFGGGDEGWVFMPCAVIVQWVIVGVVVAWWWC